MEKFRLVSPRLIMTLCPRAAGGRPRDRIRFGHALVRRVGSSHANSSLGVPGKPTSRIHHSLTSATLVQTRVTRLADGVIANTRGAEHELHSELKVDRQKVKRISLLSPPPIEALNKGGPPREPSARPLFLFVGQLTELKNVEQLLIAVKLVTRQHLPVAVWIVGDGPLGKVLHTMTRTLELEDIVTFHGSVPYSSIGHIFEACDVFVMPSHVEYRSMAVLEAVRFGKPILDSALDGNVGDMVIRGYNGYTLIRAGRVNSLN